MVLISFTYVTGLLFLIVFVGLVTRLLLFIISLYFKLLLFLLAWVLFAVAYSMLVFAVLGVGLPCSCGIDDCVGNLCDFGFWRAEFGCFWCVFRLLFCGFSVFVVGL